MGFNGTNGINAFRPKVATKRLMTKFFIPKDEGEDISRSGLKAKRVRYGGSSTKPPANTEATAMLYLF
jgi:hypothetical protein